ncbi:MAG: hypothetical protein AAF560_27890 [Acidobacteriota bacterium]
MSASSILARLAELPTTSGESWEAFDPEDWPQLFALLAVAADLPRLVDNRALSDMPDGLWPELRTVTTELRALQGLVDLPIVPGAASPVACRTLPELESAVTELEQTHCVTVDFLLEPDQRTRLDALVAELAVDRLGQWGQLERDEAPELFDVFDRALAGEHFRRLTGFDHQRDEFTLTLSLQDLDRTGIGWHRDLYWPREWVGQDVFAVLYGLGDDAPEKGGAFLYYTRHDNAIRACYRQKHQATVLWNSREDSGRILHAVSRYLTEDTSRHLIILQCLR